MIARLRCALKGHRLHMTRWRIARGPTVLHRDITLRPCTRCPAWLEVERF